MTVARRPPDDDEPVINPVRHDGTFLVFDFCGEVEELPSLLEEIARWIRTCAEYVVHQIDISSDETAWMTVSVTVFEIRPGDVMQGLEALGDSETARRIGDLVTEHGLREGLRRAGFAYRG